MKIVAISDQHGYLPDIPPCDLLIVAGDNCPDHPSEAEDRVGSGPQVERQREWFERVWMPWRQRQPAKRCLLTWGNHDYCGELLHQRCGACVEMVAADGTYDPETVAVVDSLVVDNSGLRIWLTPWSSQWKDWAFMAEEHRLSDRYRAIPTDIDILVSHQPPKGYGDAMFYNLETMEAEHLGSEALLDTIDRVRPRVVICGHVHSGHGHYQRNGVSEIYNVAVLDAKYEVAHPPTEIDMVFMESR